MVRAEQVFADFLKELRLFLVRQQELGLTSVALDWPRRTELSDSAPVQSSVARTPVVDAGAAAAELLKLKQAALACKRCGLSATRTHVVFGQGTVGARLLFLGLAPDLADDLQAEPLADFNVRKLFMRMLAAMGLQLSEVYLTQLLKCRLPLAREPLASELQACRGILKQQIAGLKPEVIVTFGPLVTEHLLNWPAAAENFANLRGKWQIYREGGEVPVMPTWHPRALVDNVAYKKEAWLDLQAVLKKLGLTPPAVLAAKP